MNCQLAENLISKKLDHQLSADEEQLLFSHLDECPSCKEYYGVMLTVHEAVASAMEEVVVPVGLHDDIMVALDNEGLYHKADNFFVRLLALLGNAKFKVASVALSAILVIGFVSAYNGRDIPTVDIPGGNEVSITEPDDPNVPSKDIESKINDNSKMDGNETVKNNVIGKNDDVSKGDGSSSNKPSAEVVVPPQKNQNVIALPQASANIKIAVAENISLLAMSPGVDYSNPVFDSKTSVVYFMSDKTNNYQIMKVDSNNPNICEPVKGDVDTYDRLLSVLYSQDELPIWMKKLSEQYRYTITSWAWSYDNKIAFSILKDDGDTGLYLANSDGYSITELSNIGGGSELVWSADNKKIAFTNNDGILYVANIGVVTKIEKCHSAIDLDEIRDITWHLNSTELVFSAIDSLNNYRGIYKVAL